jgi:hypothetical protein
MASFLSRIVSLNASMDKESLKIETEKRVTEIKRSLDRLLKNFEVDLDTALQSS